MGGLARAASAARPEAARLWGSAALGAGAVAAATALLAVSGYLISRAAEQPPILTLLVVIVAVRVLGMARAGLRYGERLASHDLAFGVLARLRTRLWRRLAAAPSGAGRGRGDLLNRFVDDVEALQHVYLRGLGPPLTALLVGALAVVAAWLLLPAAGPVLAAGLLVGGLGGPLLAAGVARLAARRQAPARAELSSRMVELVEGGAELAVNGLEEDWAHRAEAASERLGRTRRLDALAAGAAEGFGALAAGLTVVAVLAVGVEAVGDDRLDGVVLAALVLLALGSFEAIAPLREAARHLLFAAHAAGRIEEVTAVASLEPAVHKTVPTGGDLCLEDVGVRFEASGPRVLDGADLRLATGDRVALVGPSGAGKTTLASLLVRLRDPDRGRATLGGVDLRELPPREVRAAVRLAGQDAHLFTATIAQNVRLARPEASDDEVLSALAEAGLGDWIASLPEGIETRVGRDGGAVSGGQRQRIALARTLLADARFLIFDEPTAHVDGAGAAAILRRLAHLEGERGVLVITHCRDGLEDYDRVLELRDGRIA